MDKSESENKIRDTNVLIKKIDYDTKITEIEGKFPDVTNLAAETALTTVANEIPSFSSLVKETGYVTEVTEIENKLNNYNYDKRVKHSRVKHFSR